MPDRSVWPATALRICPRILFVCAALWVVMGTADISMVFAGVDWLARPVHSFSLVTLTVVTLGALIIWLAARLLLGQRELYRELMQLHRQIVGHTHPAREEPTEPISPTVIRGTAVVHSAIAGANGFGAIDPSTMNLLQRLDGELRDQQ